MQHTDDVQALRVENNALRAEYKRVQAENEELKKQVTMLRGGLDGVRTLLTTVDNLVTHAFDKKE